jgi:vitamin-K-epoxide reductase (warfarin-sensitive)
MRYVLAVLALAGLVVSTLALRVHYSTETEPCSINEHWDCGVVNHSPFAMMGRVPVAAIGMAGYLVLGVLALARMRFALHVAALLGLVFALRLTFIEKYDLLVWCLYCVISQGIIAVLTVLSLGWLGWEYRRLRRGRSVHSS